MNNTLEIMSDTPTTYNKEVRHRVGKRLLPSTDSENEDDPHIDSCPSSDEFSEITVGVAWSATNDRSELPVLEFERIRTYSPSKDWGLTSN